MISEQDFCSGRESDSLQTPNISSLPSKPGWPRMFLMPRYNLQRFHHKFQAWNGRKLRSVKELFPFMGTASNFAKSKRPLANSV